MLSAAFLLLVSMQSGDSHVARWGGRGVKLSEKIRSLNPSMVTCHLDLLLRRFMKIRMHFHARQLTVDAKNSGEYQKAARDSDHSSKSQMGAHLH